MHKIDDVYNQLVTSDIYLEKYLPYNNFCQLSEVLHVALEKEQLAKIADYEKTKLQNYLADILMDRGRINRSFDKKPVSMPPETRPKPHYCDCTLKDFENILDKQVKLSKRSTRVIKGINDRRQTLF